MGNDPRNNNPGHANPAQGITPVWVIPVSASGNDALIHQSFLDEEASSVAGVPLPLATICDGFQRDYREILDPWTYASALPRAGSQPAIRVEGGGQGGRTKQSSASTCSDVR